MQDKTKLGVALTKCYFCGKDDKIIMNTRLTEYFAKKVEEMNGKIIDTEPCPECKKFMKQGVILISVKDDDQEYRTGGWCVMKDEAIKRIFPEEEAKQLLKMRAGFIADSLWDAIGIPRGNIDNRN